MSIDFVKLTDFTYSRPDQLSPLVRRVICRNPGPYTYTGSGTYLVGTEQIAVIDPGPQDADHLAALLTVTAGAVSHILITHTHSDHCGGAMALAKRTGAPIYAFSPHPSPPDGAPPALEEGADFSFQPDIMLQDGETLHTEEWSLKALHTPGHISNHLCFELAQEQALFTGDHMMGWATTVIAAPDGNMADYLTSLDLLLARQDILYYPTHGAPIPHPHRFVRAVKIHRQMRDRQILEKINPHPMTIMEIVALVYKNIDKALHVAAAMNVHAHLARHVENGTIDHTGTGILDSIYQRAAPASSSATKPDEHR